MRKTAYKIAATLALLSAGQAQAAATDQCLTRPELRGMIAYVLPSVVNSAATRCSTGAATDSFFASRAPQLLAELEPARVAAFPMARQAFKKFGGDKDRSTMAIFDALPEEVFRPIVEAVVTEKIGGSIKPESCGDIDRIMKTIAPLPSANVTDLLTEVVMVAARNDRKMRTCAEG